MEHRPPKTQQWCTARTAAPNGSQKRTSRAKTENRDFNTHLGGLGCRGTGLLLVRRELLSVNVLSINVVADAGLHSTRVSPGVSERTLATDPHASSRGECTTREKAVSWLTTAREGQNPHGHTHTHRCGHGRGGRHEGLRHGKEGHLERGEVGLRVQAPAVPRVEHVHHVFLQGTKTCLSLC